MVVCRFCDLRNSANYTTMESSVKQSKRILDCDGPCHCKIVWNGSHRGRVKSSQTMEDNLARVLMISKACLVGIYQRKLEEIAAHPDIELAVLVPPCWQDERGTLKLERAHLRGYALRVIPITLNGNFHLHYYPTLRREIAQARPDIVHVDEEPYNLATFQATWLARRAGARVLFFTWQNINRRYPPPFSWMESYVLRHSAYGLVGNQEAIQVWRAKGYTGPLKLIPQFGVDPDIFKPAPGSQDTGKSLSIGYVGRLVEEKGIDVLLRAAAGLPGLWRVYVLGSGPEREPLECLANELGIGDRVLFDAPIPSTQMPAYYRGLDVLVLPSRTRPNWKEQFGRVLIEAMACGVPVVGSTCGEIPQVIAGGGLVFPENDAAALRECLIRLQRDEALRADLSRRGRQRVLSCYSQARIAAETVQVYQEMLGHLAEA